MKKQLIYVTLFVLNLLVFPLASQAQAPRRHARVLELEKNLTTEAQNVMRDFAPGKPFSVTVKIDAVHRSTVNTGSKEKLPYYESTEEIKDEWDDPNQTDFDLLNRVNRINLKVTIPTASEKEKEQVQDLKINLASRLALIDGRDLIEITEKAWPTVQDHGNQTAWILGIGFTFLVILGLIYLSVSSFSFSRIVKAISNVKLNIGDAAGSPAASAAPSQFANENQNPSVRSSGGQSDFGSGRIQFNDSLKMTEVIINLIKIIEARPSFPALEDMILLEDAVRTNPEGLSGLLGEFPLSIRKKIFSLSSSNTWLEALTKNGEINQSSFDLANRLAKIEKANSNPEWEELLVLCWRLDQKLPSLLRKIPNKDALSILSLLPRSIAIRAAREAMPGEWAVVLRNQDPSKLLMSVTDITKYKTEALRLMPLRPTDSLETYKREMDLVEYLKTCDPVVEKEVYGALPADSILESLRPPFFAVLEAEESQLKEFVPRVNLEEWALVCMNISKSQRSEIEQHFNDRQKIRFIEFLKKFDKHGVNLETIGEARRKVAAQFQSQKTLKTTQTVPLTSQASEAA